MIGNNHESANVQIYASKPALGVKNSHFVPCEGFPPTSALVLYRTFYKLVNSFTFDYELLSTWKLGPESAPVPAPAAARRRWKTDNCVSYKYSVLLRNKQLGVGRRVSGSLSYTHTHVIYTVHLKVQSLQHCYYSLAFMRYVFINICYENKVPWV